MSFFLALVLSTGIVAVDQLIKFWVVTSLKPISSISFIEGILDLTYVENYGAAYGIFQNKKWFLIIITGVLLSAILYLLWKKKIEGKLLTFATVLIVGGGFGNLVDRIFRGFVVDYLDIGPIFSFPVFNFADCCVVSGTVLFVIYVLFLEGKQLKKGKSNV